MVLFKKFVLLSLFFFASLLAEPVNIDKYTENINILMNADIYLDKTSKETIATLVNTPEKFSKISKNHINYGYIFGQTVWIKFTVQNDSNSSVNKLLVVDNPNINLLNLYNQKGKAYNVVKSGLFNRVTFKNKLFYSFPINLDPNESTTYYLEAIQEMHSMHFTLSLQDKDIYYDNEFNHQAILIIFFSALSVILIFNLILFTLTKESLNFYYVFFVFTLFIYYLSFTGMTSYFMPQNINVIKFQATMHIFYTSLLLFSVLLFVSKFLSIPKNHIITIVFKIFTILLSLMLLLNIFGYKTLEITVTLALLGAFSLILIGLHFLIVFKTKNSKYFFFVWTIPLSGFIYITLYDLGVINSVIPYTFELSVFIEKLLFSSILITQVYGLKNEKIELSLQLLAEQKSQLEKDKVLLRQSKLASMGKMMRNITHQWRQPLSEINAVTMNIDANFHINKLTSQTLEDDISRIENLTEYMSQTIENFNSYFKPNKQLEEKSLEIIVNTALNLTDSIIKSNKIKVSLDIQNQSIIKVYTGELLQVLLVLIKNSIDALENISENTKTIKITVKKENDKHSISVEDNGGGIHEENIDKIFDPYFTTKSESNGTGIGLYMSKMLIQESMNGELKVQNTQSGAKFTILL